VYLRKRPLFQHESDIGEFDVVTCGTSRVAVHDARMHPDFVRMFVDHHLFDFDAVFGEDASNDRVYDEALGPLVDAVVRDGITATVRRPPSTQHLIAQSQRVSRS
jgi:hypothetical protein